MNRITHFEISAEDPKTISKFYEKVFEWKFDQWEDNDYWMITTGKGKMGINGGLMKKQENFQTTVDTIEVKDMDKTIKTIEENHGEIAIPKRPIKGMGGVAYFKDPEKNNLMGVFQLDKNAK
jgi:hypothetical protein